MGSSKHWLAIMDRVAAMRMEESVLAARRVKAMASIDAIVAKSRDDVAALLKHIPSHWPAINVDAFGDRRVLDKILQAAADDPMHPENWHRRSVDEQLAKPQAAAIYLKLRRALWSWEEFAAVSRGAMAILHVVFELARDEAFPWYVAVPAEHVRRLARMSTRHYIRSIQELDGLAITRAARIVHIADRNGMACFPGTVDEKQPCEPIAQFVVRYRRGIPHNKKRAAWWINYDLLCQTQRVQRCFVFSPRTLSKTYRARNSEMGGAVEGWAMEKSEEGFTALEESLSQQGLLPPAGLRGALWREAI